MTPLPYPFHNYYIDSAFNLVNSLTGKIRKPITQRYESYVIKDIFGKPTKFLRHRLLAIAFIPNPNNYRCVNHIDGNKLNNSLNNLEWCSHSQNNRHAYEIGLKHPAKNSSNKSDRVVALIIHCRNSLKIPAPKISRILKVPLTPIYSLSKPKKYRKEFMTPEEIQQEIQKPAGAALSKLEWFLLFSFIDHAITKDGMFATEEDRDSLIKTVKRLHDQVFPPKKDNLVELEEQLGIKPKEIIKPASTIIV